MSAADDYARACEEQQALVRALREECDRLRQRDRVTAEQVRRYAIELDRSLKGALRTPNRTAQLERDWAQRHRVLALVEKYLRLRRARFGL